MTENLIVNPSEVGAHGSADEVRVTPSGASSSAFERIPRRVPLFIPREQAYYWTREWQEGIRRSMADLEAGNYTDYSPDVPGAIMRRFVGEEN
jgi:hypothetical protein